MIFVVAILTGMAKSSEGRTAEILILVFKVYFEYI
jgi:hypothetical protein